MQSTISQERLNELAILSIEQDLLENIEYKNLISKFVKETVCIVIFQWFFFLNRKPYCIALGLIISKTDHENNE